MAEDKTLEPLLQRVFMFLEDGDWSKADSYCEKVLDQDPENAKAYLGKLMAEFHVRRQEDLPNCKQSFNNSNNYQKVVRLGDEKLVEVLSGYIDLINERNENTRLTRIYSKAVSAMNAANSESTYKAAAETFKTISGFKDSDELSEQCLERAEVYRKDKVYASAMSQMTKNNVSSYETAIKMFRKISDWKDADEQICACQRKIEEIKAKIEAERLESERQEEKKRIAKEKMAKNRKRIIAIAVPMVLALYICVRCFTAPPVPSSTSKNVRTIHNIYMKEELDDYSKTTLYNFGLNDPDAPYSDDKKWNETWVVTEDFVKEYIETYSAEEFIGVYKKYIVSYITYQHDSSADLAFFTSNPQLLEYISNTSRLLFEMPELFEVVNCNPATDEVLKETSETKTVSGRFNVGSDNHIEWRESELTIDTYYYSGYYVEHRHGFEYDEGEYGWSNGNFNDVPASFVPVDEYRLCLDGASGFAARGKSLKDLNCKFVSIGTEKYYERVIYGIQVRKNTSQFPKTVCTLTNNVYSSGDHYIIYG